MSIADGNSSHGAGRVNPSYIASRTVTTIHFGPLRFDYEVTERNGDGSPWMPDGHGYWAAVSYPSTSHTKWRSISLSTTALAQPQSST